MNEFPGIQAILDPHSSLEPNGADRTLNLLCMVNGRPSIQTNTFTPTQWRVLIPLLKAYPGYIGYETLLADVREVSLAIARQQLTEARRTKRLRQELKVIRNVIVHLNQKLARFHLTAVPVPRKGYTLTLLEEKHGYSTSFTDM